MNDQFENILDWDDVSNIELNDVVTKDSGNIHYDQDSYKWISSVTKNFGDDPMVISKKMANYFKEKFNYIKLYHATKIIDPESIRTNGLKKLSPELIYNLVKSAEIKLNEYDKNEIASKLRKHKRDTTGFRREHIYFCVDKYYEIYDDEGSIDEKCSFFNGSEAISHILPDLIKRKYNNKLDSHGKRLIITAAVPFNDDYFEHDDIEGVSLKFFTAWYARVYLKQERFTATVGLNVKKDLPGSCIMGINEL